MAKSKMKECIRCKVEKINNGYNFKKTKSTMGLADSFDIVCRRCRDIAYSSIENEKRKKFKRPTIVVCKNRNCDKEIRKVGFKFYCSDECRKDQCLYDAILIRAGKKEMSGVKKPIDSKWLKRGAISGVDY